MSNQKIWDTIPLPWRTPLKNNIKHNRIWVYLKLFGLERWNNPMETMFGDILSHLMYKKNSFFHINKENSNTLDLWRGNGMWSNMMQEMTIIDNDIGIKIIIIKQQTHNEVLEKKIGFYHIQTFLLYPSELSMAKKSCYPVLNRRWCSYWSCKVCETCSV